MGTRLELQSKLVELLGSKHVYYQPPESVKIEYPAIVYSKTIFELQEQMTRYIRKELSMKLS